MKKIEITKPELCIFIASVFLIFLLIGAATNMKALSDNGGRMPVLNLKGVDSDTHFSFESGEVNSLILSDIYKIGYYHFSVGDVLVVLGFIGYCIFMISYIYSKLQEKTKSNQKN